MYTTRSAAFAALACLASLAGPARAQTFSAPVRHADDVLGIAYALTIEDVQVNDQGTWLVRTDTNASVLTSMFVLVDGALVLREGVDGVQGGGSLFEFHDAFLDDAGRPTWSLVTLGQAGHYQTKLARGAADFLADGAFSTAPEFTSPTAYKTFFDLRNDGGNRLAVMADTNPSATSGVPHDALVRLTLDDASHLVSEEVVAKRGDVLGTPPETITSLLRARDQWDMNRHGQVLYVAHTDAADTADSLLMLDHTVLVREGSPAPLSGRNWGGGLGNARVALNDAGDFAFTASLDGNPADAYVLCRDDATIVAEIGVPVPWTGGYALRDFGSGQVEMDDAGNVVWIGDWNNPDTSHDSGIFRNNQLVVAEGVTQVAGQTVTYFFTSPSSFVLSPNGRWLIFKCLLGNDEAAVLVDFGPQPRVIEPFCAGDGSLADHATPCPCANDGAPGNGCAHSFDAGGAHLDAEGSTLLDSVVLASSSEPVSSYTLFLQHASPGDSVFHDGVLCASGALVRLRGRAAVAGAASFPNASFAQDSTTTLSQRGGVTLGSGTRYYSAWYRNASTTFCPPATANVTNGIVVTW